MEQADNQQPANSSYQVAWLSLDESDNDPIVFWTYLVAALHTVDAHIGSSTLSLLQSSQPPPPEALLTSLLNEVAACTEHVVLVLDDYHVITTPAIHKALLFLLEHLPPLLHLCLATRADPPLPLARWRVRNQLTEIRAADLRFNRAEAAVFLTEVMGLPLSTEHLEALQARTEGWIAGLQLAALSLQGTDDKEHFVATFSGSNRYIVDYLVDEVLNQQSDEVQSFLLHTSILEHLCRSLCDAVIGQGVRSPLGSQRILEQLEQANLFLIPLDAERHWYRYHHLFAEVLTNRLRHSQSEVIPQLHRRASGWYAAAGQLEAAVSHALAIPDMERAATLIEEVALNLLLQQSEVLLVRRVMERLPSAVIQGRPHLTLAYGITLVLVGQFDAVDPLLSDAGVLHPADLPVETAGGFAALRSTVARFRGDTQRSLELAGQALHQLPSHDQALRAAAALNMGVAYLRQGERRSGQHALAEAVALGVAGGARYIALAAWAELATYQARQGQLRQAKQTCEAALAQVVRWHVPLMPAAGLAQIGIGEILCEWNDLAGATQALSQGLQRLQGTTDLGVHVRGYTALARTQRATGDVGGALLTLQRGDEWLIQMRIAATGAHAWLAAQRARLEVWQGNLTAALPWAERLHVSEETALSYVQRFTLVRLRLAQHQQEPQPQLLTQATQLLTPLLVAAEAAGWISHVIEGCLLQACVYQAQGERDAAIDVLRRALILAEPEGYLRLFVDEGEAMRLLILEVRLRIARQRSDRQRERLSAYLDQLLAVFGRGQAFNSSPSRPAQPSIQKPKANLQKLVEPLTERELEILRLVNRGFSNNEIANQLIVTVGTVKKHLNNIFGKLGVSSRTQALVCARVLNLL